MKLIVGLGNPGKKYQKTRHNIGFMIVDNLVVQLSKTQISGVKQDIDYKFQLNLKFNAGVLIADGVIYAKPQTFMNSSGDAVSSLASYYKVLSDEIYVVHDDLDINLGEYKVQKGKGPKDHGGIDSVDMVLGTKDYWRIRVGVDNRDPDNWVNGKDYVLQNFLPDEVKVIDKVILDIVDKLKDVNKRQIAT